MSRGSKKGGGETFRSSRVDAFVQNYLIHLNATKAASAAGYSAKTAYQQGHRMLKNVEVRTAIAREIERRAEELNISARDLLLRLIEEANADLADLFHDGGTLKPIVDWPVVWRRGLVLALEIEERIETVEGEKVPVGRVAKVKFSDRVKRLELIGRHTDVSAFKDRVQHETREPLKELFQQISGRAIRPKS